MRPSESRSILWGAAGSGDASSGLGSAGEEIKRNLDQGFRPSTLEGQNPREDPAVSGLNPRPTVRDFRKGQSPETEAYRAGPALRRREQR